MEGVGAVFVAAVESIKRRNGQSPSAVARTFGVSRQTIWRTADLGTRLSAVLAGLTLEALPTLSHLMINTFITLGSQECAR